MGKHTNGTWSVLSGSAAIFIAAYRTAPHVLFHFNVTGMANDVWLTFQPGSAFTVLHCMHVSKVFHLEQCAYGFYLHAAFFFFF